MVARLDVVVAMRTSLHIVIRVQTCVEARSDRMPCSRKGQTPVASLQDVLPVQQSAGNLHEAGVLQPKLFENGKCGCGILEMPMRNDML